MRAPWVAMALLVAGCLESPQLANPLPASATLEETVRAHVKALYARDAGLASSFYNDTIVDLGGGDPCRGDRAATPATGTNATTSGAVQQPTTSGCDGDGANWTREDWREMQREAFRGMEARNANDVLDLDAMVTTPFEGTLVEGEHFTGAWWRPLVGDVQVRVPGREGDGFFGWYRELDEGWRYVAGD